MEEYRNEEITVDDWLNFYASRSNHWVLRYWLNNRQKFFDRFLIIGDKRLFIVGDKEKQCVYEFKKPDSLQLNLHDFL